jgi:hypothetical protein
MEVNMFPNWKSTLYELNIHGEDVRLIGTSIDRAINEKAARHIAGQKFSRSIPDYARFPSTFRIEVKPL